MKRRLLNLLTLLSPLLCAPSLVCWGRSYRAADAGELAAFSNYVGVRSCDGVASVAFGRAPSGVGSDGPARWEWDAAERAAGPWQPLGFEWGTVVMSDRSRALPVLSDVPAIGRLFRVGFPARFVGVPWWLLAGLTALPAIRLRAACRRRKWRRAGRCTGCGYDLRGTPMGCPECGTAVASDVAGVGIVK
ncbi:MAG TPA: hypothetical protein VFB66_32230 [Tepidisphaeraceae bacterium]|nr:hypothetical protein [Tepidisphaeraceae bacterium]